MKLLSYIFILQYFHKISSTKNNKIIDIRKCKIKIINNSTGRIRNQIFIFLFFPPITGLFGTGVLSYFTFLRWLLYINLIVSLLTLCFLFVPQMVLEQSVSYVSSSKFSGLELLTGEVS